MTYYTNGERDTMEFAGVLAKMLNAGDTVLLEGDLGTGKSVIARGVARALGISGAMPSPTFTLMIPYSGIKKLYHFDLYRLADPDEFYEAGLDEFIGTDGIALVEWPQMAELEPEKSLHIRLERMEDDEERKITLTPYGIRDWNESALSTWRKEK